MKIKLADILFLLDKEKRSFYICTFVAFLAAILEMVGVGSITPFVVVLTKPETTLSHPYLKNIYDFFKFSNTTSFLYFIGGISALMCIISNIFSAFSSWMICKFSNVQTQKISNKLLSQYMEQDYDFFLQKNSSVLLRNVAEEVNKAINGVVASLLRLIARAFSICFILFLLLFFDPVLALCSLSVACLSYYIISRLLKKKLAIIGALRLKVAALVYKTASEVLTGIKEIKVLGREPYFINRYAEPSLQSGYYHAFIQYASELPRYIFESIIFATIFLIALYIISVKGDLWKALPVISLYVLSGYRLMPSLNGIFNAYANIQANLPAFDLINNEMKIFSTKEKDIVISLDNMQGNIELKEVNYKYGETSGDILKNINIEIPKNKTVAFVGQTGVGKTTLINLLLGLLMPTSGSILIGGKTLKKEAMKAWRKNIGYIPQDIFLYDDTIARNISFGTPEETINRERLKQVVKISGIDHFIENELPDQYETRIGERGIRLSGGQKQRIAIARALYNDPSILIFDEATSALDIKTEEAILQAIQALSHSKTIIMITHRLSTLQTCDVIYLLENGMIKSSGTYDYLVKNNPEFRALANFPALEERL